MNVVEEIKNKKIIHWFRNDQRVSDHEVISVHHTLKSIRCFYITNAKYGENHQLGFPLIGDKRKQFINESLQELKKDLEKLGKNARKMAEDHSWEMQEKKLLRLYEKVLEKKAA